MPISIRSLAPEEIVQTSRITLECMRVDYGFLPRAYLDSLTVERELADFEAWLHEDGSRAKVFGVFVDDQMAGYTAVSPTSGEPEGYDGEVNNLFVRAGYRGQGIGLMLLQTGLEYLRGLGHKTVILYNYHPSASNAYYHHLGGSVVYRTVQEPGGVPVEIDVFAWEIGQLLQILQARLQKYTGLRV